MKALRRLPLALPVVVAFLTAVSPLAAQPSPLSNPNPVAPVLNLTGPVGMQRGTSLDLTLTGTNLAGPTALWTSFPAKVTIPRENNNGNDPAKLLVKLEVPADAPLGTHTIRLATGRGLSNLRTFCIDDLPQVIEADNNRTKATAQPLTVPCVVVGRADAEASDYFKITAKAGQRLSFDVLGRRLGSGIDPQITIFDAASGREVVGGQSLDAPGCQTDPRLTMTFKQDGDYLIEVRDTTWRGGPDFFYRLRIGDFPCATTPLPMAVKRGGKASVNFAGPMVESVAPVEVTAPSDPLVDTVWVAPKGANGLHGWPVAVAVSDVEEVMEAEPNNDPAKPQRLTVPCGVTGRFLDKGDIDHYAFPMAKGQRLIIEAQTQELYSPTEVYMVVKDAQGKQLGVTNPMQAPRIDFTAPADGDYTLSVEHLHYWGGPAESYHLSIKPYEPGFAIGLFLDRYDVPQGTPLNIPVYLAARRDYTGPIELSIVGPPGITGTATIAANVAPAPAPPAPPPLAANIPVTIAPNVAIGPYTLVVRGKATINGKEVVEYATVKTAVSQSLGGLAFPPRDLLNQVGFSVGEPPPFLLSARFEPSSVLPGGTTTLIITATKSEGFDEAITIALAGTPANVAAPPKNIAKGQTEVRIEVKPAGNAAVGSFPITVNGKAKSQGKDFSVNGAAVPLVVVAKPFTLTVEPLPVKVTAGESVTFKVNAVRQAGYEGPIALEVKNLPANVTVEGKPEIAMGQTSAEVTLKAAEDAAAGDKADVNVVGTATMAGNAQNPSANFTVSVGKK